MVTKDSVTIAWFAGLFEGEGCFVFTGNKPRRLSIQMTDEDILNRVKDAFGGSVLPIKKRQSHWKDAWIWNLHGADSVEVASVIRPHLGSRRSARCDEYIEKFRSFEQYHDERRKKSAELRVKVRELRESGLTHKAISEVLELDRTYITRILNGMYD